MVRIRLRRHGSKKQAIYRIVVTNSRNPRDGSFIESIGHYNPRTQPETVEYDEQKALYWLNNGASPSESVERFFEKLGTLERLKRLQKGETIETLVAEAEAAKAARPVLSARTNIGMIPKSKPAIAEE